MECQRDLEVPVSEANKALAKRWFEEVWNQGRAKPSGSSSLPTPLSKTVVMRPWDGRILSVFRPDARGVFGYSRNDLRRDLRAR